jgi:hypothetical protein
VSHAAKPTKAAIEALARRTMDAYAVPLYASWTACAGALLRRGYTEQQAEQILRSKFARWAADQAGRLGRATSLDLLRFIDGCQGETRDLLDAMVRS